MPSGAFRNVAIKWLIDKGAELAIWAVLVVLSSLFPIYVVYNDKRLAGALAIPLKELVMRGELLLVAAALAADSLSRLISRTFAKRNEAGTFGLQQVVLLLASLSFIQLAASQYSGLAGRMAMNAPIDIDYVFFQSKMYFIATLLTGAGVILVD